MCCICSFWAARDDLSPSMTAIPTTYPDKIEVIKIAEIVTIKAWDAVKMSARACQLCRCKEVMPFAKVRQQPEYLCLAHSRFDGLYTLPDGT